MRAFPFLLLALLASAGCDPAINDTVAAEVSRTLAAPSETAVRPGGVSAYVDRSASMKPFAASSDGALRQLVQALDNTLGARMYGFGFPTEDGGQVVERMAGSSALLGSRFDYVNNDYGALFAAIADSARGTHLVISDGVQSDPDEGARYRPAIEAVRRWLGGGGVFEIMTYRTAYQGRYYSEVLAAEDQSAGVTYSCDDRPLHVFAFAPDAAALTAIRENLEAMGLETAYDLVIGPETAMFRPEESAPAGERRVPALASFVDHEPTTGQAVFSARPVGPRDEAKRLPFRLAVDSAAEPWRGLSEAERQRVLAAAELTFDARLLGNLRRGDALAYDPVAADVQVEVAAASADGATYVAAARLPDSVEGLNVIAWQATARLSTAGAYALVPAALSTADDRTDEACGQTLNIRPFLAALIHEHFVLGRALLLTEQ